MTKFEGVLQSIIMKKMRLENHGVQVYNFYQTDKNSVAVSYKWSDGVNLHPDRCIIMLSEILEEQINQS